MEPIEGFVIIFSLIIPLGAILLYIVIDTIEEISKSRKKPKLIKSDLLKPYPRRNYDQEMTDILKEAEKIREELPLMTLWWGLDGLRLNRDGTTEWISKKPKQVEKYWLGPDLIHSYPIPTYPLAFAPLYQPLLYGFDCQNATTEDRISFPESQQCSLQMAQYQNYQTRVILDSLMPARLYANDEVVYDSQ